MDASHISAQEERGLGVFEEVCGIVGSLTVVMIGMGAPCEIGTGKQTCE